MIRPTSVVVFGYKFKIKYLTLADNHGETNLDTKEIYIDSKVVGDNLKNTILHEVIHAILLISGQSFHLAHEYEEALVRTLEHGLAPLVTMNMFIGEEDE